MSKTQEQDNLLNQRKSDFDDDDSKVVKQRGDSAVTDDDKLIVPETFRDFSIAQWIIVVLLYVIFALLASFIIYISATWNQDRTNEYT